MATKFFPSLRYFVVGQGRGGQWGHIMSWSLQELLAVAYLYCFICTVTLLLIMYCFEWDLSLLVFSSLPETFQQSPLWFMTCQPEEVNLISYAMFSCSFIFQLHTLLPERLNAVLKAMMAAESGGQAEVGWMFEKIRDIQLLINLFNVGLRHVIYCIKLMCISVATVNGYGAIAFGPENLLFLALASAVFVDITFLYAFVYAKAFAIPDGMQEVQRMLRENICMLSNVKAKTILARKVRAMPL